MDDRVVALQPEIGPALENSEASDLRIKSTFFNYPVWTDYSFGLFPPAAVAAGVIVTARSLLLRGNLNERLWNVCCT
jgi:hypothetical protein